MINLDNKIRNNQKYRTLNFGHDDAVLFIGTENGKMNIAGFVPALDTENETCLKINLALAILSLLIGDNDTDLMQLINEKSESLSTELILRIMTPTGSR